MGINSLAGYTLLIPSRNLVKPFEEGKASVRKAEKAFSLMALDQTREQLNAQIKGDSGAVGLFGQQGATVLKRWMVVGPPVSELVNSFREYISLFKIENVVHHHEDYQIEVLNQMEEKGRKQLNISWMIALLLKNRSGHRSNLIISFFLENL